MNRATECRDNQGRSMVRFPAGQLVRATREIQCSHADQRRKQACPSSFTRARNLRRRFTRAQEKNCATSSRLASS